MLRSGALLDDLRKSEATLESAQRLVRLGNWTWDLLTDSVTWTAETYRLLGYPRDHGSPRSHDYLARVHPEDADAVAFGAVTLGAVTLGASTLGVSTLGASTSGSGAASG